MWRLYGILGSKLNQSFLDRMSKETYITSFLLTIMVLVCSSCIEEFEAETLELNSLLVVDGLLTDEMKFHEIRLSRVFAFEEENPAPEQNAKVVIVDDVGNEVEFVENSAGTYQSKVIFAAEQSKSYQLKITTSDNKSYESNAVVVQKK